MPGSTKTDNELRIGRNRKLFGFATIFFGALLAGGLSREISGSSITGVILVLVVFGLPSFFYARGLGRGPVIIIDADGLTDLRSGRVVRWATTSTIILRQRQGVFGEYHHLVCTAATGESIDLSIDQLSLGWKSVVSAVEDRAGRSVTTLRERGLAAR